LKAEENRDEKQEIRAKALELMIAILALLPDDKRREQFVEYQRQGIDPSPMVIDGSKTFEDFITGPK
jgi:hypothetical protein